MKRNELLKIVDPIQLFIKKNNIDASQNHCTE